MSGTQATEPLDPMPEEWRRALAVVAHPDDLEYGAAGAIARWTAQGRWVAYLLASRGEAGIDSVDPLRCARLREEEQRQSARLVGVDTVEFLTHRDGLIEYGVPLRWEIAEAVRRHRPELVVTVNHHSHWPGGAWNVADHRAVGLAALDAVRDAANRWLFREQFEEGIEPWGGVRWVAVAGSPYATHAVDVGDTIRTAMASLAAHRTYLAALGDTPMADPEFLRWNAETVGARFGGRPAVAFELLPT